MAKQERPVVLCGRFTKAEERCIERQARQQNLSVSDYVRTAAILALILDGDVEAMKLQAGQVAAQLAEKFARFLDRESPAVQAEG